VDYIRDQLGGEQPPSEPAVVTDPVQAAVEAAGAGTFEVGDVERGLIWSTRMKALFGFAEATSVTHDLWLGRVHADDRQRVDSLVRRCIEQRGEYTDEYRIREPGGRCAG
jgi:PAS domain-containing protein